MHGSETCSMLSEALELAIKSCSARILRWLLRHGADAQHRVGNSLRNTSLLHVAANVVQKPRVGNFAPDLTKPCCDMIDALCDTGLSPLSVGAPLGLVLEAHAVSGGGLTLIPDTPEAQILEFIGGPPSPEALIHWTPLHVAARTGSIRVVGRLILHIVRFLHAMQTGLPVTCFDVQDFTNGDDTSLHLNPAAMALLKEWATESDHVPGAFSAAHVAALHGHVQILKLLTSLWLAYMTTTLIHFSTPLHWLSFYQGIYHDDHVGAARAVKSSQACGHGAIRWADCPFTTQPAPVMRICSHCIWHTVCPSMRLQTTETQL